MTDLDKLAEMAAETLCSYDNPDVDATHAERVLHECVPELIAVARFACEPETFEGPGPVFCRLCQQRSPKHTEWCPVPALLAKLAEAFGA